MFNNIGHKLQSLAKVVCWIGIVCSVIMGIAIMAGGAVQGLSVTGASAIVSGLLTIVLGCLFSWIGSWTLYAFGQLVEDVHEIKSK